MNLVRVQQTLDKINKFGASGIGINRLAYTEEEQHAQRFIEKLCIEQGMTVRVDCCSTGLM